MALSAARHIFGIHSITPYSRTTGLNYGTSKVLKGASLNLSGETVKLQGGSYAYSWAVEDGYMSGEISFTPSEYPEFLFELFLGKAPTESTSGSGSTTTLTNKSGSSIVDAATGIASVGVTAGSQLNLKFGKYTAKYVSPTTIDIYCTTDADFNRGTDVVFQNDDLKITETPLTITTGGSVVAVPNFGISLTGGSGTIALSATDTATFEVLPPSSRSYVVKIGGTSDRTVEFGAYLVSEPLGNGEFFVADCYRCRGIGLPIGLTPKEFSESEIKADVLYDTSENAVCQIRSLTPSSAS